jgi:hypothetical protein
LASAKWRITASGAGEERGGDGDTKTAVSGAERQRRGVVEEEGGVVCGTVGRRIHKDEAVVLFVLLKNYIFCNFKSRPLES